MWRKNRSPNGHYYHPNSHCIGVDLNRNFGYHWMGLLFIQFVEKREKRKEIDI